MTKLTFSVYAICKDEIKNVDRWISQFYSCDHICVLDTGSTDGTYEKLLELSKDNPKLIISQKIYKDFHYDEARNDCYKLVPKDTDVCLVLDFDEVLEKSWYNRLVDNYSDYLTSNILDIKRKRPHNKHDYKMFSHPYFDSLGKWYGYNCECLNYNFENLSLDEINERFKYYFCIRTNVFCEHYSKDKEDDSKLFYSYIVDTLNKVIDSGNIANSIVLMSTLINDPYRISNIEQNKRDLINLLIEKACESMCNLIIHDNIDFSLFKEDLSLMLVERVVLFYVLSTDCANSLKKTIIEKSSDSEKIRTLFYDVEKTIQCQSSKDFGYIDNKSII